MADVPIDLPAASLLLEEAMWQRGDQLSRLSALDQKLTTTFTLNVAVIAVFAASISIAGGRLPLAVVCLFYSTVFLFTLGVGVSTKAYLETRRSVRPDLRLLRQHVSIYETPIAAAWIADEIIRGLEETESLIDKKGQLVWLAVLLATTTSVMVGVTVAVYLAFRILS